jgi:peptidoglycan/xylan/chitin deacetylase (PgdA/CDA1 family)
MLPRLTVCLTFDFDAMSPWVQGMAAGNLAAVSRGEFGAVAIPRILALLSRHEVPATFFVPGHTALAYPELVRRIAGEGHEIGHHGWVHESVLGLDREQERDVFVRGLEALDQVLEHRPVGYRAPSAEVGPNTVEILLEHGMRYDASFSGSDFDPYYLRRGDSWSTDRPYVFGSSVDLVGIPFFWGLSDFTYFEFVDGATLQQSPASAVYEIWHGELEYALAHAPGGVYDLCLHPQVIGRGHRLLMLERLIAAMQEHEEIAFSRLDDYAARWRGAHPLAEWLRSNPLQAGRA